MKYKLQKNYTIILEENVLHTVRTITNFGMGRGMWTWRVDYFTEDFDKPPFKGNGCILEVVVFSALIRSML